MASPPSGDRYDSWMASAPRQPGRRGHGASRRGRAPCRPLRRGRRRGRPRGGHRAGRERRRRGGLDPRPARLDAGRMVASSGLTEDAWRALAAAAEADRPEDDGRGVAGWRGPLARAPPGPAGASLPCPSRCPMPPRGLVIARRAPARSTRSAAARRARGGAERIGSVIDAMRMRDNLERAMAQILATDERMLGPDGPRHPRRAHPAALGRAARGAAPRGRHRRRRRGRAAHARVAAPGPRAHLRDRRRRAARDARADRPPAPGPVRGPQPRGHPRRRDHGLRGARRRRGHVGVRGRLPGQRRVDHPADHALPHPPGDPQQRPAPRPGRPRPRARRSTRSAARRSRCATTAPGSTPRPCSAASRACPWRASACTACATGRRSSAAPSTPSASRATGPTIRVFLPRWTGPAPEVAVDVA